MLHKLAIIFCILEMEELKYRVSEAIYPRLQKSEAEPGLEP